MTQKGLMEGHLVDDLALKERDYWWHRVRRANLLEALRGRVPAAGRVLEIGCGTGANLRALRDAGYETMGFELDPVACRHCFDLPVARADALDPWPLPDNSVDAVVMLDVLEHLGDPGAAVDQMRRVLKPGGVACLMVPAGPELWSYWDEMLGHHRRYSPALLQETFGDDWRQLEMGYSFSWMTLPVKLVRKINGNRERREDHTDFVPLPWPINGLLVLIGTLERRLRRLVSPPSGTTLQGVWEVSR